MRKNTSEDENGDGSKETDQYIVDETPEQQSLYQRKRDHSLDSYSTGYDELGDTRVGIGSAGGDVSKLVRHNEGRHRSDGDHSAREAARDKIRITESFCSTLPVTSYQQHEAVTAMTMMNLDRFGQQKRLNKVALGTIKVVVEWDQTHRRGDSDPTDVGPDDEMYRILSESEYRDRLEEHDISKSDLYSVSQLVKRELKKHSFFERLARAGPDADSVTADDLDDG